MLVDASNHSRHRSIRMTLANVEKRHEDTIWTHRLGDRDTHINPPMARGTMVRISKNIGVFDKGCMPYWSNEHFIVEEAPIPRRKNICRVYKISDYNNDSVKRV